MVVQTILHYTQGIHDRILRLVFETWDEEMRIEHRQGVKSLRSDYMILQWRDRREP